MSYLEAVIISVGILSVSFILVSPALAAMYIAFAIFIVKKDRGEK